MLEHIITFAMICVNVYLMWYLYELEKNGCKCAMNWRRTLIMFIIGFWIVLELSNLMHLKSIYNITHSHWFLILSFVLTLVNVIIIYQYIKMLDTEDCKCSKSSAKGILEAIAILDTIMYILIILIAIRVMFLMYKINHAEKLPSIRSKK